MYWGSFGESRAVAAISQGNVEVRFVVGEQTPWNIFLGEVVMPFGSKAWWSFISITFSVPPLACSRQVSTGQGVELWRQSSCSLLFWRKNRAFGYGTFWTLRICKSRSSSVVSRMKMSICYITCSSTSTSISSTVLLVCNVYYNILKF